MTPEIAYEEALRRIREAELIGALELDLSGLPLDRLPQELGRTSLHSLNPARCLQLSGGLSPLTLALQKLRRISKTKSAGRGLGHNGT
jgi:hypothetical protein